MRWWLLENPRFVGQARSLEVQVRDDVSVLKLMAGSSST